VRAAASGRQYHPSLRSTAVAGNISVARVVRQTARNWRPAFSLAVPSGCYSNICISVSNNLIYCKSQIFSEFTVKTYSVYTTVHVTGENITSQIIHMPQTM